MTDLSNATPVIEKRKGRAPPPAAPRSGRRVLAYTSAVAHVADGVDSAPRLPAASFIPRPRPRATASILVRGSTRRDEPASLTVRAGARATHR